MKSIKWHIVWKYVSRAIIAICGVAAIVFIIAYLPDLIETKKREHMAKVYEDSVWIFQFHAVSFGGDIGFKITDDGRRCRYICSVIADSGFCFDTGTYGKLFVKLLDKDGFVLDEIEISSFINIVDIKDPSREEILRRQSDGTAYVGLDELLKTKIVSASTTLKLVPVRSEKKDGAKDFSRKTKFDEEMEEWTKKVERIKIGMTYKEMVGVAGQPRIQAETFVLGYDRYKYNYGRRWVIFKDGLVYKIE